MRKIKYFDGGPGPGTLDMLNNIKRRLPATLANPTGLNTAQVSTPIGYPAASIDSGVPTTQMSGSGPSSYTWNPNPGGMGKTPGIPVGTGYNLPGIGARRSPNVTVPQPDKPKSDFAKYLGSDKFSSDLTDVATFGSNIINSFRRPPMPKRGMNDSYTGLQRVNLQDERNQATNTYEAANRSTERNIDSNTAEAVKAFNRGQEMSTLSSINSKETATNVGISNQEAAMHAATSASNTAKENKFRDELVERDVARQRESSANVANAGDKYVMMQNEKRKGKVEIAKANVLATAYDKSGVLNRSRAEMKKKGIPDPLGKNYQDLEGAYGGIMKGLPSKRLC